MALPLGTWINIRIGGSMVNDTWSTGLWLNNTAGVIPSQSEANQVAANALSDFDAKVWSNASNGLKAGNAPYATLATARAYIYLNDVLQITGQGSITPVVGTGSSIHPPYVALVATTLTGAAGRSNRGRMYLPTTALGASGTTGQQNGSPSGYATNLASWISNRAAWYTGTWAVSTYPVVMTQAGGTPRQINTLRIDTKFDTQRGRENKLIPTTSSSAAVT